MTTEPAHGPQEDDKIDNPRASLPDSSSTLTGNKPDAHAVANVKEEDQSIDGNGRGLANAKQTDTNGERFDAVLQRLAAAVALFKTAAPDGPYDKALEGFVAGYFRSDKEKVVLKPAESMWLKNRGNDELDDADVRAFLLTASRSGDPRTQKTFARAFVKAALEILHSVNTEKAKDLRSVTPWLDDDG